jgi:transmembrane sensor
MKTEDKIDFHELSVKFFAQEIADNEMILLRSWLESSPGNRRIFNETNELWQGTGEFFNSELSETDTAWADISARLGIGRKKTRPFFNPGKNFYVLLIAAASIAFLLVIGGITQWMGSKPSQQTVIASTRITTLEKEKAHIFLSDSTEVILNSESTLQYSGQYNINSRDVELTGEAFFSVKTNPEKPFVVELKGMKVTATGTSFNICSYEDDNRVVTTLEEGKIQIAIDGKELLDLKSGQQAVYSAKTNMVLVHEVLVDNYTSWKENKLRFFDTPFEEVLRQIGRKYNVEFEISTSNLYYLNYTATFLDESVDEIMKMLASVSPITYKIIKPTSKDGKKSLKTKIVVGKKKNDIDSY